MSIPQRAGVEQYESLDSYIENWDGKEYMLDSILEAGKYERQIYGLGMRPDARMFVWRKDMFESAGLDPDPPSDYLERAKAIFLWI